MSGLIVNVTKVKNGKQLGDVFKKMSSETRNWELRAARGECPWICADCSVSDQKGMPDKCFHGYEYCDKLIERDKLEAKKPVNLKDKK